MAEKFRIMFVCHGNICRSPMAEFIFKKMVQDNGVGDSFFIASSATSAEEIYGGVGNPVYPPARAELLKHGISCEGKRAVQLKKSDYEKYDLFVAMDGQNVRNILRIFGADSENKVRRLLSFAGENSDVSDPWYSGHFDIAYNDIFRGCSYLLENVVNRGIL